MAGTSGVAGAIGLAGLLIGCTGTVQGGAEDLGPGGTADLGRPAPRPGEPSPQGGGSSPPSTPAGGAGSPAGGGGAPVAADGVGFVCKDRAAPVDTGMRRLTDRQYRNTVRDLLAWSLGGAAPAGKVMAGLEPALAGLPEDAPKVLPQDLHGSYRRLDQDVDQQHVEGWYQAALQAGRLLTAADSLKTVTGGCSDSFSTDCLDRFIRSFGARAVRRPLEDAEVSYFRGFYGPTTKADPAAFADVIAAVLSSPWFLYHIEHGRSDGAVVDLSAHELAARLSYHFWDTLPDEGLWKAAETGALLRPDEYRSQVDRLAADPRTRATMREFYRDWLELDRIGPLDGEKSSPVYKAYAGAALPSSTLHRAMIDEVLDLLDHHTWTASGGLDKLLSTDVLMPRTRELATLYGVTAWDGTGAPPLAPGGERPGLFTRAAFLVSSSANTRPVMKGVFLRETVLCDEIPTPPENAAANSPALSDRLSTRQVVEELTEKEGGCAACHKTFINPLGFATENYDALGRVRSRQRLIASDGRLLGDVPVDTRTVPQVVLGDQTPASGAADLMRLIAKSGKAHACLARQYFRFTFGRWEEAGDGCVLEQMRKAIAEGESMAGMLKEAALVSTFKQRALR